MRADTPEEKYINDVFGLHDPELLAVKRELEAHQVDFMSISGHEARLLQFLIRSFHVQKIVEVGTLYGYSAIAMAKALPAEGKLITLEKSPANFEIARKCIRDSSVSHKIEALCGEAEEILHGIEAKGPFDMVFIDANKGGYVSYLNWAEKNVRRGGLIVGDNTFLFGALWGQTRDRDIGPNQIKIMSEFNTRLSDTTRYNSVLIPTVEGLTVAQKLY
jgi:predicted O-methyltransferase YrrM